MTQADLIHTGGVSALQLLSFALVFALACGSPGPTTLALVARILGRGPAGVPMLCLGLVLGDLLWLACAAVGLAAVAQTMSGLFVVLKFAGVAYLLWLAWKMWAAPADATASPSPPGEGWRLLWTGLSLALGNPKTMLFYLALLPAFIPLGEQSMGDLLLLAGVVTAVYAAVLSLYSVAAHRVRGLLQSPGRRRIVQRSGSAMMAGAAVAIALR
ncbi:MAG: LysE family translocator [Burkholderiaceae bacterium]